MAPPLLWKPLASKIPFLNNKEKEMDMDQTNRLLQHILETLRRIEQQSRPRVTYSIAEACAALGVSEPTFRQHILPHLRHFRIGGRRMILKADLEELMRQWADQEWNAKEPLGLMVERMAIEQE